MPPSELRVRLDDETRARLDGFCISSKRSLTNAVNLLLTEALDARDSGAHTPPRGLNPPKDTP